MKLKYKISLLFLLLFTLFLLIGSVSAVSNTTESISYNMNDASMVSDINDSNNYLNTNTIDSSNNMSSNSINIDEQKNLAQNTNNYELNDSNGNVKSNLASSSGTFLDLKNLLFDDNYELRSNSFTLYSDYTYNSNSDYYEQLGLGITGSVTIDGNGHTIDGNNQAKLFSIGSSSHINVIFKNINFINGLGIGQGEGAVEVGPFATVQFINCNFENCHGCDHGAALFIGAIDDDGELDTTSSYYNPTVTIQNCEFYNNKANYFGGAIYNFHATLNIVSSTFTNNYAGARGGAIYNFNQSSMGIESSTFTGNTAVMEGAAIDNVYNYNVGSSINNCNFNNNKAYKNGYYEGTIVNVAGLMVVTNSKISNNNAKGLSNYANGYGNSKLTIKNCEIKDNIATGIMNGNTYRDYSTTNVEQCIITGNNGGIVNNEGTGANIANTNVVNAHYNVIYGNGVNIENSENPSKTSRVYAQYNWWGSNSGATGITGTTVNTAYPVQLTLYPTAGSTTTNTYTTITAYLNQYKNGNSLVTLSESIPTRTAYFSTTDSTGKFSSTNPSLLDSATVGYTSGSNSATISVQVDNQVLKLYINSNIVKSVDTYSYLNVNPNFIYLHTNTVFYAMVKTLKTMEDVSNGTVNFYANNTFIGSATVVNGDAKLTWFPTTPGNYTIKMEYLGNDYYNPSNNTNFNDNTVNVISLYNTTNTTSNLTINPMTFYVGNQTSIITQVMTINNTNVMNGTVYIYVNSNYIGSANVTNGKSEYTWTPTKSGIYEIYSEYAGNHYYEPSTTNSIKVSVKDYIPETPNSTELSANPFVETFGQGKNFTATLLDLNGKPIIGQHVAIKLSRNNGQFKTYWTTTDTDGNAMLQINLSPGSYKAEVNYGGNKQYNASAINSTIIVNSASDNRTGVVLTTNKFSQPYGAGQNFTGTLKDTFGNLLIGQHVAVNLTRLSNGASKIYWVTTDTDGAFQLQINLGLGEYTAQCSYGGTSKYQPASAGNTISVTNP